MVSLTAGNERLLHIAERRAGFAPFPLTARCCQYTGLKVDPTEEEKAFPFCELFYSELFARAPQLKLLYRDRRMQARKLSHFLMLVVNGFENFGGLVEYVCAVW